MDVATIVDISLAAFWVGVGFTLLIVLYRQQGNLAKMSGQLSDSSLILNDCRSHLAVATSRIKDISRLSGMVAHVSSEIREPLNTIGSAAWIIRRERDTDPDAVDRFSDSILSETRRLTEMIDRLLTVVETEASRARECVSESERWIN